MINPPFTLFEQTRQALEECARLADERSLNSGSVERFANCREERNAFRVIATYLTEEGAVDLRRLLCK